jgi:hypothetical protein
MSAAGKPAAFRFAPERRRETMGVPAQLIEIARDANLVAAAEQRGVELRYSTAHKFTGRCPACTTQLSINIKTGVWSCGQAGGGPIEFVQHVDRIGFGEAVAGLAGAHA